MVGFPVFKNVAFFGVRGRKFLMPRPSIHLFLFVYLYSRTPISGSAILLGVGKVFYCWDQKGCIHFTLIIFLAMPSLHEKRMCPETSALSPDNGALGNKTKKDIEKGV